MSPAVALACLSALCFLALSGLHMNVEIFGATFNLKLNHIPASLDFARCIVWVVACAAAFFSLLASSV